MLSERVHQRIERLLGEADEAVAASDWSRVRDRANNVLAFDPENLDAQTYLAAADRALAQRTGGGYHAGIRPHPTPLPEGEGASLARPAAGGERAFPLRAVEGIPGPTSFGGGRYAVKEFLGEGGKKRVYLAHDEQLDRDVAFALLKSDGLDKEGLVRIRREAQAMGRLGDHPNIVTVFDIGDENGQPYIVSQYMGGGSLQEFLAQTESHRLSIEQVVSIGDQASQALEHAHSHGVIHRDLKPGNVFLAASPHSIPSPRGRGGRARAQGVGGGGAGRFWIGDGARSEPPRAGGNDGGHRLLHAAGTGARRRGDPKVRSVCPGRHALRVGHGPASVSGRRKRGDHHPTRQHAPGGPDLAPARLSAGPGSADSAVAGEGPGEAASVGGGSKGSAGQRGPLSPTLPRGGRGYRRVTCCGRRRSSL